MFLPLVEKSHSPNPTAFTSHPMEEENVVHDLMVYFFVSSPLSTPFFSSSSSRFSFRICADSCYIFEKTFIGRCDGKRGGGSFAQGRFTFPFSFSASVYFPYKKQQDIMYIFIYFLLFAILYVKSLGFPNSRFLFLLFVYIY